ncbi:peptidoglycan-binding protein [Rhodanobacter sp. Root480]|uniref:LysM peptidoglycan-binding domain-containing protein n=1 Tax=Rhodanobacter sp. Root480 TaxID=1736542 RepID=UPI0006FDFBD2|nr:LysM peptidoglycan-binding domain-containing protein [Rhodanobacter sp. Root480]KQX97678.1 peptidoglycan-binding protein [Rhodanobacter sp. Root480]
MANDDKPGIFESREVVREQAAHMAPADKADFSGLSEHLGSTVDRTSVHAVVEGDTLSSIAQQVYGDGGAWERIYAANRDQLTTPDKLEPGQMLKIPAKP